MEDLKALVALNMIGEIGSLRLNKLLECFHTLDNILNASQGELSKVLGIKDRIVDKIVSFKKENAEKEIDSALSQGLKIITIKDQGYPESLKNIPGAPIVLYVRGELLPEDRVAIGVVGSRRASYYGLKQAEEFASGLALNGFAVVSGMARGIDTYSHRGALKSKGRTIAVIGSGFNNIYPPENIKLALEISENGAVISEFPLDSLPLPHNFPRRNRLISGLSLGVLVVEAARNSGALITADFALEQGRDVFAIPGKIDSYSSAGTNNLIKQGAKLVSCIEDITEEYSSEGDNRNSEVDKDAQQSWEHISSKNAEDILYGLISSEAIQFDELVEKMDMGIPKIHEMLLRLQLRKLIRQLPGKQFIRS